MSVAERGLEHQGEGLPWAFQEQDPWERGFAAYFRDWIMPELGHWQEARRAQERRFRRRLPLLVGGWLVLILLVAEASGSLPITLTWAVLLLIVGGSMARGPVERVRSRALATLRDQVMGFFGLRPLDSSKVLAAALKAQGWRGDQGPWTLGEQFWGIHRGIGLRLASLRGRRGPVDRSDGPRGLLLRIEVAHQAVRPQRGRWSGPCQAPEPPGRDEQLGHALQALSQALGGAVLDYALDREQILILAHRPLEALDWTGRVESWDPRVEAQQIEAAMRTLLRDLHSVLGAARGLASPYCEKT